MNKNDSFGSLEDRIDYLRSIPVFSMTPGEILHSVALGDDRINSREASEQFVHLLKLSKFGNSNLVKRVLSSLPNFAFSSLDFNDIRNQYVVYSAAADAFRRESTSTGVLSDADDQLREYFEMFSNFVESNKEVLSAKTVNGSYSIPVMDPVFAVSYRDKNILKVIEKCSTYLTLARHEFNNGDREKAEEYLRKSEIEDFVASRIITFDEQSSSDIVMNVLRYLVSEGHEILDNSSNGDYLKINGDVEELQAKDFLELKKSGYGAYHCNSRDPQFGRNFEFQVLSLLKYFYNEGSDRTNHLKYDLNVKEMRRKLPSSDREYFDSIHNSLYNFVTFPGVSGKYNG